LSPLSVLVGPNGCGKSTVLDALLIGAHPKPKDAIERVLRRRSTVQEGPRWLFWRSGTQASVVVKTSNGGERACALTRDDSRIHFSVSPPPTAGYLQFDHHNKMNDGHAGAYSPLKDMPVVHLVEPHRGADEEPLYRTYTRALEEGRIDEVNALLAELLPGFKRVEILAPQSTPVVYVTYQDRSVPAGLQGDGVQSLLRLALELAAAPGGLVLLEVPEAAQHPRSLHESARAIVAAVRRGVQVILSTHSLDLIDMLRTHLDQDLARLSVHHLACPGGELSVVGYNGTEIALARDTIGEDLR
jgi:predicted ATPase